MFFFNLSFAFRQFKYRFWIKLHIYSKTLSTSIVQATYTGENLNHGLLPFHLQFFLFLWRLTLYNTIFEGLIHKPMADTCPHPNNPVLIFIDQTVLLPRSSPAHGGNTPKTNNNKKNCIKNWNFTTMFRSNFSCFIINTIRFDVPGSIDFAHVT